MKRYYDGMEGVVEIKWKNSLCISNCYPTARNFIRYEQLGVYIGDTTGIEETDTIRIYFYHRTWRSIIKKFGLLKGLNEIMKGANIERVEFVRAGTRPKGIVEGIKNWFNPITSGEKR